MSAMSTPASRRRRPEETSASIYGDRQLIPRIEKLMSQGSVIIPDELSIVDQLQHLYPEYKRKKRSALKTSVTKALEVMDSTIDDIQDVSFQGNNSMNRSVSDMYTNKGPSSERKVKKQKIEKKETSSADKAVEKLLQKQVELKERFIFKPKLQLADLGGIEETMKEIEDMIIHLRHPEMYKVLGIEPPKGLLLCGPPGVGKSALIEALVHDLDITCLKCTSTELITGISGESEAKIRELFSLAQSLEPCVIFIDDIDAISPKKDGGSKEMEKRIVIQLSNCIDGLDPGKQVFVIGVTSKPETLDSSLRRSGRFDREIVLRVPDEKSRTEILTKLCKSRSSEGQEQEINLEPGFSFETLARNTPGYVGADLKSLIRVAAVGCLKRHLPDVKDQLDVKKPTLELDELKNKIKIEMLDFKNALKTFTPSAKREGFATVPDVTWDDVGALGEIRQQLKLSILAPIKYPDIVKALGSSTSIGILLCGPPGCGKTLLAKAIANESRVNFVSIKGPELLNMYVGESERAVRAAFARARDSKPCVLFFDEIDALCRRRSEEGSNVSSSVVNQLLTEMDGLESRDCILLAATNRPDILDPAILRPGRFDKTIYVGFPNADERLEILTTLTRVTNEVDGKRPQIHPSVDLKAIAFDSRTNSFTGADLKSLVHTAALNCLSRYIGDPRTQVVVTKDDFEMSLAKTVPSVSEKDAQKFHLMSQKFSSTRNK